MGEGYTGRDPVVIVLNGYPHGGKDTFVRFCGETCPEDVMVRHISTVDQVKKALMELGWKGTEKANVDRDAMAQLKWLSTKLYDGPFKYVSEQIKRIPTFHPSKRCVIFVDCREPEEIDRMVRYLKAATLLIEAREPSNLPENSSDRRVNEYAYDYVIPNFGTLDELKKQASNFIRLFSDVAGLSPSGK